MLIMNHSYISAHKQRFGALWRVGINHEKPYCVHLTASLISHELQPNLRFHCKILSDLVLHDYLYTLYISYYLAIRLHDNIGISTNQNLHIHFYEWNSKDVTILINWHIYIVCFNSHFKIILDFPIADETYTYFLTNHSTTSVKFHHVTVNTLCYSMIKFVYTHVIVMYNFGGK